MKNLAVRALRCVLYANHPLSSDALRDAVATLEDYGELDPAPLDVILEACANAITEEDGTVRLIHGSLRDFFLTQSSSVSGSILHQLQDSPTSDTASATPPLSHPRDSILEEGPAACPEDLYPHIKLHQFLWHSACFFDRHMEALRQLIPAIEELMAALLLQSPLVLVAILLIRAVSLPGYLLRSSHTGSQTTSYPVDARLFRSSTQMHDGRDSTQSMSTGSRKQR